MLYRVWLRELVLFTYESIQGAIQNDTVRRAPIRIPKGSIIDVVEMTPFMSSLSDGEYYAFMAITKNGYGYVRVAKKQFEINFKKISRESDDLQSCY